MQNEVQLVHGLRVAGEVSITGAPTVTGDQADLELRLDPPGPVPESPPPGELVASLDVRSARYEAALDGETLTIRFHETAEFEIDLATGRGAPVPSPAGRRCCRCFWPGNVLAIVLGLRGVGVVHASTVEINGAVLMVAGPSGAGKSTLAALVCAAGGRLVGDDTARIERLRRHGPGPPGLPASFGCAPRPRDWPIGSRAMRPETGDGRVALRPRLPGRPLRVAPTALLFPAWRPQERGVRGHARCGRARHLRCFWAALG